MSRLHHGHHGLSSEAEDELQPLLYAESSMANNYEQVQRLRRRLSARQVSMIAIGGTIGTGLFLGTGRSLAQGGPGSILICYALVGLIVYVTLLLLGEMATQHPVAGTSFRYLVFRAYHIAVR